MAAKGERQINSFIKGLITESSPLTFPENASMDEDNFVLNRDGSRSRRLGMEYEEDYRLNDLGTYALDEISFHEWKISGGGTSAVSIGVVRVYNKLWFLNMLDRSPSSALLNGGVALTVPYLANAPIETAVINNALIVVGKDLPTPTRLSYDEEDDTVTASPYTVFVRDFWGVYDALGDNERPATLTNFHKYNLRNQGWSTTIQSSCGTDAIDCTKTNLGVYPSNCDVWSLGKIADSSLPNFDKYDPAEMVKHMHSFMVTPKGKNIIDVFNRGESRKGATNVTVTTISSPNNGSVLPNKSFKNFLLGMTLATVGVPVNIIFPSQSTSMESISSLTNLSLDKETGSFTTVASYAGRVFYSGVDSAIIDPDAKSPNLSSYVFFTQTMLDDTRLGKCYQEADPTSADISDIIATDGGSIHIPDAISIVRLVPTKSALLVFAENGIWQISGGQANFSATDYELSKISSIGTKNTKSIVVVNSEVFYWAKGGIFRIVYDEQGGGLKSENLSLTSIQTRYNSIGDEAKSKCKGVFEEKQNTVRWLYNDSSAYDGSANYNRELVLDLTLGAFYPNTISNTVAYIADFVRIPDYSASQVVDEIVVSTDPVLIASLDEVVVNKTDYTFRESPFSYLTIIPGTYKFTLSKYSNRNFYDWTIATGGTNYSSYLVTGYEVFGEIMRKKYVPYVMFYLEKTEDGFSLATGNLEASHPSSCLVQAQWNWANSANSGKWGTPFQAYRLLRNYIPSGPADTFDYGDRVIVTKNKLRGSGRTLSLKLSSEAGKDMKILGWAMTVTGNTNP